MTYERKTIDFKSIKEMPAADRPREKLVQAGPGGLADLELLCVLIGSGSHTRPVHDIAHDTLEIIDKKGSRGITVDDLKTVPGLGPAKAASICAGLEIGRRFIFCQKKSMNSPASVFDAIRHYGDRLQEHFITVILNGAHELMGVNVVYVGLVNRTIIHPREVFCEPLKMRATAIILAHNHPSGNLEPSSDDIETTIRLKRAGQLLGIEVLDHLIFSYENYRSLLESGELM